LWFHEIITLASPVRVSVVAHAIATIKHVSVDVNALTVAALEITFTLAGKVQEVDFPLPFGGLLRLRLNDYEGNNTNDK
jgi:hypothetical protein